MTLNEQNKLKTWSVCLWEDVVLSFQGRVKAEILRIQQKGSIFLYEALSLFNDEKSV